MVLAGSCQEGWCDFQLGHTEMVGVTQLPSISSFFYFTSKHTCALQARHTPYLIYRNTY